MPTYKDDGGFFVTGFERRRPSPLPPPSIPGAVDGPEGHESLGDRARACVRLAADITETPSLAAWFRADERGFWESKAITLLRRCESEEAVRARIVERGLGEQQVNELIANKMVLEGLEALIIEAAKR